MEVAVGQVKSLLAICLLLSTPAMAETVSVAPHEIGVWNGWRGGCMVEPFEGPKCGLEKRLARKEALTPEKNGGDLTLLASQLTKLNFGELYEEAGRVWVTIDKRGTFISFQPGHKGIVASMTLPSGSAGHAQVHIRIDGNDIWTLIHESPQKSIALYGEQAEKIIREMKAGRMLYMRPNTSFAESYESRSSSEEFSLEGFNVGVEVVKNRFEELDNEFPYGKNPPVKPVSGSGEVSAFEGKK
jgi:hypothetical protein